MRLRFRSMGSSIGNFTPSEAVDFLAQFAAELTPDDLMLIALDGCQDPDRVYHAYNDRGSVTHNFTSNGLKHANKLLGYEAFRTEDWEATGEFDQQGKYQWAEGFSKPVTSVVAMCNALRPFDHRFELVTLADTVNICSRQSTPRLRCAQKGCKRRRSLDQGG